MPDNILIAVFGVISLIGFAIGGICFYFAIQNAKKNGNEITMALWSFGGLAGIVVAGMCWAYFLIPILYNHITSVK
ncbi:MAG: hypothetical protein V1799_02935 [bacterium]